MTAPDSSANPPPHAAAPLPGRISTALHELVADSAGGELPFRHLFEKLTGRGHAALLVVLGIPFCLPIPLPGLSVIFGVVLLFVGLRIAFGRRPWLPRWVLERRLRAETILGLARGMARFERLTGRMIRPRLSILCRDPRVHVINGLVIATMGILLALPLPIPFTNIPAAIPVLLMGLGMLEDDGVFVILGYATAFFALGFFFALFWFGKVGVGHMIDELRALWS